MRILTTIALHGAQHIHPIWIGFSTYRNALSESFVELNILPILHLFFGLLKSLTFLTLMRSLLRVLCTHIIITSFLIRLTYTTFLTDRQVHTTCNTWNANNYQPYFCRTNIQQFTILHLGPKLWNSLPHNLTERTSYSSFKTSLKKYLIERAIN